MTRNMRTLLVALAAASLALTGCSALSSSSSTSGSRRLVWSTSTPPGTLDVIKDQVNGTTRRLLLGSVVEGLTKVNDENNHLSWSPLLATAWKRVDPHTWQFSIRKGVTFQDGSGLDANDVAYSVNKLAKPSTAKDSTLENISGAKVVDKYTVDVKTIEPDFFVYRAMSAVPIQPDGWGEDPQNAQDTAIGTGPYRVKSVSSSHDDVVLTAWDGYWGDVHPHYTDVEMKVVPDAGARLAGLRAGETNVAFDLSPDLLNAAPATVTSASSEVEILRISTANPVLADQRVRQALNYAVDRKTLINKLRFGFAEPPHGQGVTPQVNGFNPHLKDYPYDPAKAKELVQQAGATGAKLTMMCVAGYYGTVGTDTCQTLASAYESAGLNIKVEVLPHDPWVNQGLLAPQNHLRPPDLFYVQAGSGTLDAALYIENYFTCGHIRATICDPQLRDTSNAALAVDNIKQQDQAFQRVNALAHTVAPMVWITSPENAAATQAGVSGPLYSDAYAIYWYEWTGGGSE